MKAMLFTFDMTRRWKKAIKINVYNNNNDKWRKLSKASGTSIRKQLWKKDFSAFGNLNFSTLWKRKLCAFLGRREVTNVRLARRQEKYRIWIDVAQSSFLTQDLEIWSAYRLILNQQFQGLTLKVIVKLVSLTQISATCFPPSDIFVFDVICTMSSISRSWRVHHQSWQRHTLINLDYEPTD